MPLYNPQKTKEFMLDPSFIPASVIISYTEDGKIKPLFVHYENPDETMETLKISYVQNHTVTYFGITIRCLAAFENKVIPIIVIYLSNKQNWYLKK